MLTKFLNNIAFRKALIELCKQNTQFEQVQRQITDILKILIDNQDNRQIEKLLKINKVIEDENTILRKDLERARQALAKIEESNA